MFRTWIELRYSSNKRKCNLLYHYVKSPSYCTNIVWTSFNTALSQVFPSWSYRATVKLYSFKWRNFVIGCTDKLYTLICWDVLKDSYFTVLATLLPSFIMYFSMTVNVNKTCMSSWLMALFMHTSVKIKVRISKIDIQMALAHT